MTDDQRNAEPRDTAPPATARSDRLVHEASEESFPASDPPQYTRERSKPQPVDTDGAVPPDARAEARRWADEFVGALDHDNVPALMPAFTEDAVLRIGTGELLVGHKAISTGIARWLEQIGVTRHHVVDVRVDHDAIFVESEVTYQTGDGVTGMWPEVISARRRKGAASRLVIYGAPSIPFMRSSTTP